MTDLVIRQSKRIELILRNSLAVRIAFLCFLLFCFFVSVEMLVGSFRNIGGGIVGQFMTATSNPFIGLFAGILVTSITQSSSSTTSLVVAIVASGVLSLQNAVPVILGANIGTTVTSTLVSLGHIHKKKEFERAISAGTLHDFFNILTVIILLPLEFYFHILSGTSAFLAGLFDFGIENENVSGNYGIKSVAAFFLSFMKEAVWVSLIVSAVMLFTSLRLLVYQLKSLWIKRFQENFNEKIFGSSWKALLSGAVLTGIVQSSSVTTSLTVPLVATQKITLEKAFPFIVGANIGTTVTALLVAVSKSDAALAIALCHFLFNVFGAMVLLPVPFIRQIPIYMASALGKKTMQFRIAGFLYILLVFFVLPFLLIFGSLKKAPLPAESNASENVSNKK
jgi:sodium-dependent phosphate cotransporter